MGRRDRSRSLSRSPKPRSKERHSHKEKKEHSSKRHKSRKDKKDSRKDKQSEQKYDEKSSERSKIDTRSAADHLEEDERKRKRQKPSSKEDVAGGVESSKKGLETSQKASEKDELDSEAVIERRRQRVAAWQEARRKRDEEEKKKAMESGGAPEQQEPVKVWSLENDDDDQQGSKEILLQKSKDVIAALRKESKLDWSEDPAPESAAEEGGAGEPAEASAEVKQEEALSGGGGGEPTVKPEDGAPEGEPMQTDERDAALPAVKEEQQMEKQEEEQQQQQQQQQTASGKAADDEVDPLDAFMSDFVMPEAQKQIEKAKEMAAELVVAAPAAKQANGGEPIAPAQGGAEAAKPGKPEQKRRRAKTRYETSSDEEEDDDEEEDEEEELDDEGWAKSVISGKLSKSDKLAQIDHSQIDYMPFRRDFYIEVSELSRMTEKEVDELRSSMDNIKARGKNVPKPIKKWTQCGLSTRVLEILKRNNFEKPSPIQAQALPVIMSGRDCIGIAKTGSGKTLAFVLPMIRHIKDQPPIVQGDGPIALIMAPTRELVQQIGKEIKRFSKAALITVVNVFGGSGVANQISDLKRGTEVVVCTPGRMIDILATSNGKITNLRRVTYLVLDEADRMFDMGFEPQIMRIVHGVRPDRQTVLFSATFPRSVEMLARQVLDNPVEIQVGGRSVVNSDIAQFVEIRPEAERFLRLLEVLGEWCEKGKILIFVSSQDKCDSLFRDLLKSGYPCLSLHGGKDQSDRECTISDFKSNVCSLLIATSVAARGLDVKDLVLVVNYDPPNHHEDYVHRVGRTGRAGNKGTAITFLGPDDDKYAPDIVKALKESKQDIPADLQSMADAFSKRRAAGLVQAHGSGFGGSGYKFDSAEEDKRIAERKALMAEYKQGDEDDGDDDEDEDDGIRIAGTGAKQEAAAASALVSANGAAGSNVSPHVLAAQQVAAQITAQAQAAKASGGVTMTGSADQRALALSQGAAAANPLVAAAQAVASQLATQVGLPATLPNQHAANAARAAAFAAQLGESDGPHYEAELEINDFPQHARWKVTHKDALSQISEMTGAAITTRGQYFRPGTTPPAGEKKLYLLIEGPTELSVKRAKQEIKRVIEETTEKVMRRDAPAGPGRYSVL